MIDGTNSAVGMLREVVDDDRIYYIRFRTTGMGPDETDRLEEHVTEEAKRIEETVGCVTFVDRTKVSRLGPTEPEDVMLFGILPRRVDLDLFACIVEEAHRRALMKSKSTNEGD